MDYAGRIDYLMISKLREPVNGLTHLGGAAFALVGTFLLLILGGAGSTGGTISIVVYGVSLVTLFLASAIYHLANVEPKVLEILRKLDHSAIFILIAGTYTPFCVIAFKGFFHWGLLGIIWAIAITGILVKIFFIRSPRWLNATVYVVMGWLCISAAGQMSALPAGAAAWLIAGGVIYTLGAVVYSLKLMDFWPGRFGFHEAWHVFVLLGAMAHFISVLCLLSPFYKA